MIWVLVPTFNERDTLPALVERIARLPVPDLHVLVVDDDSPDGTWRVAEQLAATHPNLHVLRRITNRGRGAASRDGYLECLRRGADVVIEMDADLSHDPEDISSLVAALGDADMVVGSRLVPGGADIDRWYRRQLITVAANLYVRTLFGVSTRDCTSGYRSFTRSGLERIDPETLASKGPEIIEEVLFRAVRRGLRISEQPITFQDRTAGQSKIGFRELRGCLRTVLALRWRAMRGD